jgi:hypothetical protein
VQIIQRVQGKRDLAQNVFPLSSVILGISSVLYEIFVPEILSCLEVSKSKYLIGQRTLNLHISLDVKIDGESVNSDE